LIVSPVGADADLGADADKVTLHHDGSFHDFPHATQRINVPWPYEAEDSVMDLAKQPHSIWITGARSASDIEARVKFIPHSPHC